MSYALSKPEIAELHELLAAGFYEDRLYEVAFPNQNTRMAVMLQFFRLYIKAIAPYCHIYADSMAVHSILIAYDSRLWHAASYTWSMLRLNAGLLSLLFRFKSFEDAFHALRCYGMFTSAWVKDFKMRQYYHLDLLCTCQDSRRMGYARKLVEELIVRADEEHMDITLETHELSNVEYYERFGFALVKTITHDGFKISQYCMLRRCREETANDK